VAIKVPTYEIAADPVQARRFAREARAAARIVHPGVVAIYAVGELDDGRPYLAMQLIDGEPLDRVLGDGLLAPLRALRIARNIASALSETHAADVVHRDLKPTNIIGAATAAAIGSRWSIQDRGGRPGTPTRRATIGGLIGTRTCRPSRRRATGRRARRSLRARLHPAAGDGAVPFEGRGRGLVEHLGRHSPRDRIR
jgi:hypothetical protein